MRERHARQHAERSTRGPCRIDGIRLAGDWIDLPIPAMLMEGAFASGMYAANDILAAVATALRAQADLSPFERRVIAAAVDIARLAGSPRGARQVSRILHSMSSKYNLPWHRVINAQGKISRQMDAAQQRRLLEAEGLDAAATKTGTTAFYSNLYFFLLGSPNIGSLYLIQIFYFLIFDLRLLF